MERKPTSKNYQYPKRNHVTKNQKRICANPKTTYTLGDIENMVLNTDLLPYKAKAVLYKLHFVPKRDHYLLTVERYHDKPSLFIKLHIPFYDEENHKISVSVVDGRGNLYASFYNRQYGQNDIVERIDRKLSYIISTLLHTNIIQKEE